LAPAGFSSPRHVTPPSLEAATSCRRSPVATPARPCLFLVPQHVQEPSSTTFIHSCSHILLPRFLLRSAPPQPRRTLCSPLLAASAAPCLQFRAPPAPLHPTKAPEPVLLHPLTLTPLEHRASRSVHCCRSTSPSSHRSASLWPSLSSPPPLHLLKKLHGHIPVDFLHSICRNATAASRPRRAGSVLHRAAIFVPSCFDSDRPRARHELLNLFPHFPLAAGDPRHRNLLTAVAVPLFKLARDPIADILFFLGSSLQNISTPTQFKSANFENL
jgi:hypothetical protein